MPGMELYFNVWHSIMSLGEFKGAHWQELIEPCHFKSQLWPLEQFNIR